VVVGLPDGYAQAFPGELRNLTGAPTGVLLAQQTAANLHSAPGGIVTVGRPGQAAVAVPVEGIVDLPLADSLFQKVGAPPGAQLQAPPDNVLLVPATRFAELFPAAAPVPPRSQVHVRLDHRLPADPAAAFDAVAGRARNLEVRLAGAGKVGDNLGATLDSARGDALYAQVLFLFLGLPGALLAALLTAWVAAAGRDRRRREQALLRTRGASTRQLMTLAGAEAAFVGVTGGAVGLAVAAAVGRLAFGTARLGTTTGAAAVWAAGCLLAGLAVAWSVIALPARADSRALTVRSAELVAARRRSPWWARAGVDALALAGSALVFWLTGRNGYKLVLAPEGVPAISVSYWALAGPALLWLGAGLLAWRLVDLGLRRGRAVLGRLARPVAGNLAGTVAATLSRQRRNLARAVVLVSLTAAFAASTAVFNATYRHQAGVDARLTNGADVTVAEPPGSTAGPSAGAQLASLPGVRHVEPLQHRFAYVGSDLQDLYGVRPGTVAAATRLQDAYFAGGTAKALMARLAAEPDGILVSAETVHDFQLVPGDRLQLRLQDGRTRQLTTVAFRYLGVAKEFPTAPRDSFLVANAGYVADRTGSDAVGAFLLDTGGHAPGPVARQVSALVGPGPTVTDLSTTRRLVGSSLTAVDLTGLTRVELGFALALAVAACGLALALGFAERRRTFAIAGALGAGRRQLASLVWSEAAVMVVGGLGLGAVGGWTLAHMLVKVLTGVFDPPPSHLQVPWTYLCGVVGAGVVAAAAAAGAAVRSARRAPLSVLRER
jgi:putative ABC transport system permease protein